MEVGHGIAGPGLYANNYLKCITLKMFTSNVNVGNAHNDERRSDSSRQSQQ